jgi:hypothetical protein
MISEAIYSKRIAEHITWHLTEEGEPLLDLSCPECHPAKKEFLTSEFVNF